MKDEEYEYGEDGDKSVIYGHEMSVINSQDRSMGPGMRVWAELHMIVSRILYLFVGALYIFLFCGVYIYMFVCFSAWVLLWVGKE